MARKEATVCERGQSSGDGEEERDGGIICMPKPTGLINMPFGHVLEDRERGK